VIFDIGRGYPESMLLVLTSDNGDLSGEYKETHYNWIFPQEPAMGALTSELKFNRRWWIDGIYSVHIKPDVECVAEVK
jgi:hypothetical protein